MNKLQSLKIFGLVTGVIIKSAAQGIIIPIIVGFYQSMSFVLLATSLQFMIIFGSIYFYQLKKNGRVPIKGKLTIFLSGLFTGLMAITMIYAANPKRTPVLIQTILAGLPVIPSVILRKFVLKKTIIYRKIFIILSIVSLISSVAISTIPVATKIPLSSIGWIFSYAFGVICLSTYNVLQEKYINDTMDYSFYNKVTIMFFSRIVEFLTIISFFWLEYFFGTDKNPIHTFYDSLIVFTSNYKASLLLEGFIIAYMFAFTFGIYLNSISTNYNMIIPAVANPLVAIFFTVFSQFNVGVHYPIYIVVLCIIFSTIGLILWVKGETNETEYKPLSVQNNDP